jgi:hypothetical protein
MALTGTRLLRDRYTLLEVLGTGGMATVWRARDELLGRDVAVKILSPRYAADPAFLTRFEREARHAASLSSPRIVTVFDRGIDEQGPFIVMELVLGQNLRQVLDEAGQLPARQAVAIAAATCEALEAAHAAGLVHRDIKPANIVLAAGGVKILDFGIARLDDARDTHTQAVLGTAAYLSPEQAAGLAVGPQADLYALGCVLFEMLTGTQPFTADSAVGLAYQHVHGDPGPPSARCAAVPEQVDSITGRLLAKDPADRPRGAAAARADLLAAIGPPDPTAVLDQAIASARRPRRVRGPRLVETVLAIALAATLVILAAVMLSGAAERQGPGPSALPTSRAASHRAAAAGTRSPGPPQAHGNGANPAVSQDTKLPPTAAAAAALVADLQAGVVDGQVTQQAAQSMFNQLQQLLFSSPGQNPQQVQQQFSQLVQAYEQNQAQGQITGRAAAALRHALHALGTAVGAL